MRNMSRILFNDGTGSLGQVSSVEKLNAAGEVVETDGVAATPAPSDTVIKKTRLVISDFKEANFEERDLVQISDGAVTGTDSDSLKQTELFEIDEVSLEAGHEGPVIASNVASSKVAANDHVIMQGSLNNDPSRS